MAITRAQQVRQMLEDGGMLVQPSMTGKRPGYRGDAAYGDKDEKGQVKDTVAAGDGPSSTEKGDPPPSYTPPDDKQLRQIFNLKPDQKIGETKRDYKSRKRREKAAAKASKDALRRFQKLDEKGLVSLLDDYGEEGEELAKQSGFTKNPDGSFTYDPGFFRDPDTGAFKEEFLYTSPITGDVSLQIPGYEFGNIDKFGKPSLRSNVGTSIESVRPNISDLQEKGFGILDLVGKVINPDTQVGAFNTLTDARNIQEFASRLSKGDDSALDDYKKYIEDRSFKFPDDNDRSMVITDPCKGPNPPAYCFIGDKADETMEAQRNLGGLAPRFAGSIFDFTGMADGGRAGLMDGGMLVQPGFGGIRQGYRSAKTQESKQKSAKEFKERTSTKDDSGPSGPPSIISPPPKEKTPSNFKKFIGEVKEKTQPVRDFLFLRDVLTGNIPGALTGIAAQLLPISQTGVATPPIATGNIVYDERLGLIDQTTGLPVNSALPGATQAKTYSTQDIKDLLNITDKKSAEKFVEDPVFGGADFITREKQNQPRTKAEAMDKFRENLLEQEIDYPEKTFDQQRSGAMEKGISPTDRSLIPSDFLIKPGEAAAQKPFVDIAKDIDREYDLAEGGLAGLARQEMFLGGIAKSLKKITKKATRAVKKIAKSDIGKAALFAGLAGIPFGAGSAGTGFFGPKSLFGRGASLLGTGGGLESIGNFFRVGGEPGAKLSALRILGAGSLALPFLMGDEEDEPEAYRGPSIDIAALRGNPYQFLAPRFTGSQFQFAADGGRIGYQEGSKEPVAKKTMPLLDMGGREMDLREDGGFVPIGRMEKADDVPARLSKNEFVFTADAVRNAGDGDVDKGAEVMYNMMKNLESGGDVSEESQGLSGAREMFQISKRLEEVL